MSVVYRLVLRSMYLASRATLKEILNQLRLKVLYANKIPNLKHQITNKSQITIFNDQNIHCSWVLSYRKPNSPNDNAVG
jgi:hypothetical protein